MKGSDKKKKNQMKDSVFKFLDQKIG